MEDTKTRGEDNVQVNSSDNNTAHEHDSGYMTREDSRRAVLDFLRETEIIAPKMVIHRNLMVRGYTSSEKTTRRRIDELVEEGEVERVDPSSLDNGRCEPADPAGKGETKYFMAKV